MIDFDLAGKVGIVRYALELDVNRKGVWQSENVHGGELIPGRARSGHADQEKVM